MNLPPEQHHEDCDYRNSHAAKQAAETFGVDVEENSEVFACNLGCKREHRDSMGDVLEVGNKIGIIDHRMSPFLARVVMDDGPSLVVYLPQGGTWQAGAWEEDVCEIYTLRPVEEDDWTRGFNVADCLQSIGIDFLQIDTLVHVFGTSDGVEW